MDYREKAKQIHESVNQKYADNYNYVLHLDAVHATLCEFRDEIDVLFTMETVKLESPMNDGHSYQMSIMLDSLFTEKPELLTSEILARAAYFHDTEEDCRMTFNELKLLIGETAADIVHAVTNHKGKNRKERANATYYKEIRETPGASFIKMCDRIANVRFSRMMGSSMFFKYQKENAEFMRRVDAKRFPKMRKCLMNLCK